MRGNHHYTVELRWTGNLGTGTSHYRAYSRNHEIFIPGKCTAIGASSDKMFRGESSRYNPEELLVAALSSCHMLSLLHLCADAGITVTAYEDSATGTMRLNEDGSGEFTEVVLKPRMTITDAARIQEALGLHEDAARVCFIARSVNFPVRHEPVVLPEPAPTKT